MTLGVFITVVNPCYYLLSPVYVVLLKSDIFSVFGLFFSIVLIIDAAIIHIEISVSFLFSPSVYRLFQM